MNILFITSNRLGDAVLSSGLLSYIIDDFNDAKITVACGSLGESLFRAMPRLDRVIVFDKKSYSRHWFYLFKECYRTNWDIIVDIRNSAVSRVLRGKRKFIWSKNIDKSKHKVEQMAELMQLKDIPAPKIWFSNADIAKANSYIKNSNRPILAIGPAANWIGKTWPTEKFIELAKRLTTNKNISLYRARIAVLSARGEEGIAQKLLNAFDKKDTIDLIAKLSPIEAAAFISKSNLYIGNDSGLMHIAAAVNVPTVGLFGPSYPQIYSPWGKNTAYVTTLKTAEELLADAPLEITKTMMDSLSVEKVEKTVLNLIK